jgi:tetraacyldisaccharide 4'-kinase
MSLENLLHKIWQQRNGVSQGLRPLSWLYCSVVFVRRWLYRLHILPSRRLKVPVIVVGNISVGGTGKTPLVVSLVEALKRAGYKPGVISRGYRGKARSWPQQVRPDSDPVMVGDEPILISRRTQSPMAVGPKRVAAAEALLKYSDCDIIVCDDGLQHYALRRDAEILVIDGARRFGNGFCLPAGPLREPVRRKDKVDFIVTNGLAAQNEFAMQYTGDTLVNLLDENRTLPLTELKGKGVHAVAGVGNPQRFFERLLQTGLDVRQHPFPDHHLYLPRDLDYGKSVPIIMTEKDAVKCHRFAHENMWYLPITVNLDNEFEQQLLKRIESHNG